MSRRTGDVRALLTALLVLSPLAAAAQADPVEFYATVDRDEVGLDETLTLSVTLAIHEGREPQSLTLPESTDFEVVSSSRNDQMSFAFGGGTPTYRKVRVYTQQLRARREGTAHLSPGRAMVLGKVYETARLTVRVGPPGKSSRGKPPPAPPPGRPGSGFPPGFGPPPGLLDEDPFGSVGPSPTPGDRDLFVRVALDKKTAYVGEQVTMTIWLLSRVEISEYQSLSLPKLDGFWTEDLEAPSQMPSEVKYVDGVPYTAYLVRRRAIFPLSAGRKEIEPVELDVITGFGFLAGGRKVHRKSLPQVLQVEPLPEGGPKDASAGNVGQWELSVTAEPMTVAVGEPVKVRVAVQGRGHLRGVEPPTLPKLDGVKSFEPSREEKLATKSGRVGGRKALEYVLVPERVGAIAIPAMSFRSFDPQRGAWVTSDSQPITIQVRPGAGGAASVASRTDEDRAGLRPLQLQVPLEGRGRPLHERPWFPFAALAPLFPLLLALVLPRLRRAAEAGAPDRARRRAGKVARKRLAASEKLAAKREKGFFAELDRALHDYLLTKLDRPTVGLTREELARTLREAGAPEAAVSALHAALEACDLGRFAPGPVDVAAVDRALTAAAACIDRLEETQGFGRRA